MGLVGDQLKLRAIHLHHKVSLKVGVELNTVQSREEGMAVLRPDRIQPWTKPAAHPCEASPRAATSCSRMLVP